MIHRQGKENNISSLHSKHESIQNSAKKWKKNSTQKFNIKRFEKKFCYVIVSLTHFSSFDSYQYVHLMSTRKIRVCYATVCLNLGFAQKSFWRFLFYCNLKLNSLCLLYSLVVWVKKCNLKCSQYEPYTFQFCGLENFVNLNNRKMQKLKNKPDLLNSIYLNKMVWMIFFPIIRFIFTLCAFPMTIRAYTCNFANRQIVLFRM